MAEKKEAKGRVQLPPFCVGSELHLIIKCSGPVQAEPQKAKVHAEDKAWQGWGRFPALSQELVGPPTVCHPSCDNQEEQEKQQSPQAASLIGLRALCFLALRYVCFQAFFLLIPNNWNSNICFLY